MAAAASIVQPCTAPAQPADASSTTYPASYFAPSHPSSALDMVRRLPGFTFDPGDPTARGLSQAAGNVVVDGKRLADKTFTLDQLLDQIPASQVDHVDLVYGGQSAIEMLGRSVVANVVRKTGPLKAGAVTGTVGIYKDGRFAPGLTLDRSRSVGDARVSGSISLSRFVESTHGDGSRVRTNPDGQIAEQALVHTRAGGTTGFAQAAIEMPAWGGQLRVNGSLIWTSYVVDQIDLTLSEPAVTTIEHERLGGVAGGKGSAEIGAHFERSLAPTVTADATLLDRIGRQTYLSSTDGSSSVLFNEADRSGETVGRTELKYHATPRLLVTISGEAAHNWLRTGTTLMVDAQPLPLPNAAVNVTETRLELGGGVTSSPSETLEIQAGMHWEQSTIDAESDQHLRHSYRFAKPDLKLVFKPAHAQQARVELKRRADQLDLTNFVAGAALDKGTVSAGNVSIRAQTSWTAEIGYEVRSPAAGTFSFAYSHMWLSDIVDRVPIIPVSGAAFDAPGNIGSGSSDMVNVQASTPLSALGIPKARLDVTAVVRRSRATDPATGTIRGISGEKPLELTAGFQKDLPKSHLAWGTSVDVGWRTKTFLFDEVDVNSASLMVSLFADWQPRPGLSFHVEAADLLSRRYRRDVLSYGGVRGLAGPVYQDLRTLSLGPHLALRVREAL